MLSFGIDASRAFWIASASPALPSGSPPPSLAATVIARANLVKCWPRRASTTAFLCLIEAHFECPDMSSQSNRRVHNALTVHRARADTRAVTLAPPGYDPGP